MTASQFKILAVLLVCILAVQLIALLRPAPAMQAPFVQNVRLIDSDIPLLPEEPLYEYSYSSVKPSDLDYYKRVEKLQAEGSKNPYAEAYGISMTGEYMGHFYTDPETEERFFLVRNKTPKLEFDPLQDPFRSEEQKNVERQRRERQKKLVQEANK